jgi:hypothetical protein
MSDLTTLARQLVDAGAFRWQAGMLPMVEMPTDEGTTWVVDTRLDDYQPETARPADGAIPCLEDPSHSGPARGAGDVRRLALHHLAHRGGRVGVGCQQ